jgi:hypothetical protein
MFIGLTVVGLFGALVVSVVWLFVSQPAGRWEPAVTCLGLMAAFAGIYAERWATDNERRKQAFSALQGEYERNANSFSKSQVEGSPAKGFRARVYPRFSAFATQEVLTRAVFASRKDAQLREVLYSWAAVCEELNHRLNLTELLIFTTPSLERIAVFERALHKENGLLQTAQAVHEEIGRQLRLAAGAG